MSLIQGFTRLHKWIALLVGLQLLIWIISGIVFSFIDHQKVRGNFIYENKAADQLVIQNNLGEVMQKYPQAIQIKQYNLLNQNVFKVSLSKEVLLLDAINLQLVRVDENLIRNLAMSGYRAEGNLKSINLVTERNDENRDFDLPVWQASYEDNNNSEVYFSFTSGEFLGVRTDSWRVFDFFMMLHFMDYGDRGDFNHGLIIFAGLIFFFFSISGMLLIYSSFTKNDFVSLFGSFFPKKQCDVVLTDRKGNQKKIKLDYGVRLMDGLIGQNIELESICGGAGICGCCRFKLVEKKNQDDEKNLDEHNILTSEEIKQGYRLACQLHVESDIKIEIPDGMID